jgi:hypothetical protein
MKTPHKDFDKAIGYKREVEGSTNYIRVGNKFFKKIIHKDINGIPRTELLRRDKQLIIDDHKREFLKTIPTYDKFTTMPDNLNYKQAIGTFYNMYYEFSHKQAPGKYDNTLKFLHHIFGDQYELGLDYLTLLYKNPKQKLPILALVSKERSTGKTTFLDWICAMFGANAAVIRNADIANNFNFAYAHANIIGIDEALIKGDKVPEKLKELATARQIMLEAKGIDAYLIPWYGKLILTGNKEEELVEIDNEETRYWIRKIPSIIGEKKPDFLECLINEIPSFLHYIYTRNLQTEKSLSRHWFDPEMLTTTQLSKVKQNSKSDLYKSLLENLQAFFDSLEVGDVTRNFRASGKDIETEYYSNDNRVTANAINRALKTEMQIGTEKQQRYHPFNKTVQEYIMNNGKPGETKIPSKNGKPYLFDKYEIETLYDKYMESVSVSL